ncbi:MAG: HU family DNA-binding protein [Planctomycetota bacterium]
MMYYRYVFGRSFVWFSAKGGEVNKGDLIKTISEDLACSKADASKYLNAVLHGIKKGLQAKDQKVQLVGFGTFVVRKRKARKGLNPRTRESINISASKTIGFRPGKELKDKL